MTHPDLPPAHHEGEEPPPPGARLMAWLRWALLLAVVAGAFTSFWVLLAPPAGGALTYTCPMVEHAFVLVDRPGECPICHMELMALAPEVAEARKQEGAAGDADAGVPGAMPVAVHLDRLQKIGVRTVLVTEHEVAAGARAPAYVEAPEQGRSQVHVRAAGFVEKIEVAQTGTSVGKGQILFHMYSPEIYRAQEELLAARRFARADAGPLLDGGPAVEAARRRLELLGLRAADVDDIERRDAPERAVAVRAPAPGYVARREVALGAYVTPEMTLYELVDLSRVYVVAELFARDAAHLRVGTVARVTFGHAAGLDLEAKVALIYPEMNAQTRTVRVRLDVPNPRRDLRPGLFGEATFDVKPRRALGVPRDAVVDTGTTQYVFIDEGEGHFAPRRVTVGAETPEQAEIVDGLRAGERVVVGATFLIDAESRLQAALAGGPSNQPIASASASSPAATPPSPPDIAKFPPPSSPSPFRERAGVRSQAPPPASAPTSAPAPGAKP